MNTKKPLTYQEFTDIYSKVTRLTVEVIIVRDNKVLLTKRNLPSWQGMWHIPGGTVFYKEAIPDAISRVAHDELGVKIQQEKLLGYIEYPSEEHERGFGWTIGMAFQCSLLDDDIQLNEDASQIDFFDVLPENTIEEARAFLEAHLSFLSNPIKQS